MLNIIKADLYRIFKGKAIYITFGILIAFIIIQSIAGTGSIGINTTEIPEGMDAASQTEMLDNMLEEMTAITRADGMTAPFLMASVSGNLIYFLLPLILLFAGSDFASGAVKNAFSRGISRTKYYFAKLIPVLFFAVLLQVFNLIIPTIVASIRNGSGDGFTMRWLGDILEVYGTQTLLLFAIACVGMFIVVLTKKTASIVALFIAFLMVPTLIFGILSMIRPNLDFLMNYDLVTNISMMAGFNDLPTADIIRMFSLCAGYIVISTAAGVAVCKKSDIK